MVYLTENQRIRQAAEELFRKIGLQATLKLMVREDFSTIASTTVCPDEVLQTVRKELCAVGVDKKSIEAKDDLRLMVQEITHLAFREYSQARL